MASTGSAAATGLDLALGDRRAGACPPRI